MKLREAIRGRHCIRAFLKTPLSEETLSKILDLARYAPSGVNSQPWQVVVVTGEYQKQIGEAIIAAREAGMSENPDYHYYPSQWQEPYLHRRKACGLALYSSMNIKIDETEKRKTLWYQNYHFFGAPAGILFFVDNILEKGSWVDMGMFIQNIMIAARSYGLETCPQASLAEYPDIVRGIVGMPKDKLLICGLAIGYADHSQAINQYRTTREPVSSFTQFLGFS